MTAKFVTRNGETFRILYEDDEVTWMISYDVPTERPFCIVTSLMYEYQPAAVPKGFVLEALEERDLSPASRKRLEVIQPLLEQGTAAVMDRQLRKSTAQDAAVKYNTTPRRVIRLYYRYLATGQIAILKDRKPLVNNTYDWAIKTFYFSAKRLSLRSVYDMMLVQKYMGPDGRLLENAPTWNSFRTYFYTRGYHKNPRKTISRSGLTSYQRNNRPAFGTASDWREQPGSYQMDATQADICLVSRHDRSKVIGRPYVYLATDTATQLIAGVYVGLECDESAVMLCLANAVQDKVSFCREYGIEIDGAQWPSRGLPHELIVDKGKEFWGARMRELCKRFGLEVQTLPPFRPDEKGLVEKSFDLIQQRYKPLLRGKGVIEDDVQERWSTDYRSQSILNLDEFTKIILHCVLYLNAGRLLSDARTPAQKWMDASPSLLDVSYEELLLMALPREQIKLTRKGLKVNRLLYVPADMDGLLLNETYTVAYSPSDLSCVYILMDDCAFKPCPLALSHSQYSGLAQPEAELLSQKERDFRNAAKKREVAASTESIQNIQSIIQGVVGISVNKGKQDGKKIQKNRSNERGKLS